RHHGARLDALHLERAEIAVQRANPVLFPQPEAGADDDRFLADAGVDTAADLALLHQDAEPLVERADQPQPIEHFEELLGGELELGAFDGRHGRPMIEPQSARELQTYWRYRSRVRLKPQWNWYWLTELWRRCSRSRPEARA